MECLIFVLKWWLIVSLACLALCLLVVRRVQELDENERPLKK